MELTSFLLALEPTSQVLQQEPLIPLAILATIILLVPSLCERLGFSGVIGLVITGIILNPSGLNLLNHDLPTIDYLGDGGLFYLLLVAGLELDLEKWSLVKSKALRFAGLTLVTGLIFGLLVGIGFGWGVIAGLLSGLIFASFTPIVYPLLLRLGVANNRAVVTTIGSKLVVDAIAVLFSAFCLSIYAHRLNLPQSISLFGWLIVYTTVILVGFDWAGREFFSRSGEEEGNQLLFVFVTIFLAVVSAQWLNIDIIFAAFIAGLAINNILSDGPIKQRLIFIGNFSFIPIFLIYIGLLVNLPQFLTHILNWRFLVFLALLNLGNKLVGAVIAKYLQGYTWRETLTVWSLFLPQINLTLALALVFLRQQLIPDILFDYAIATMLISTIIAPSIASKLAGQLSTAAKYHSPPATVPSLSSENKLRTILVPVYNPQTQQYLIEMAALLGKQAKSRIVPLAIANAAANMDSPRLATTLQRSERLLAKASAIATAIGVNAEPLLRIDDAFASGISRAAKEENASLIVIGWGKRTGLRARLFGNVIDNVLWASHCPVAVTRLIESPSKIQRILVPIENISEPAIQPIQFAQLIAQTNQAQVTLLNICPRRTSSSQVAARRNQIGKFINDMQLHNPPEIQIIAHENIPQAILQAARLYDLVILPFSRKYAVAGNIMISDITSQLARQLSCSVIMLGEPQRGQYIPLISANVINRIATV